MSISRRMPAAGAAGKSESDCLAGGASLRAVSPAGLAASPPVCRTIAGLRRRIAEFRRHNRGPVSLVPTMGAFHEGHQSLMRAAAAGSGLVVVSIFVNPLQFGAGEDFEVYPRDLQRDLEMAASAGAGLVFAPAAAEVYPPGCQTVVEPGPAASGLCGESRPGHFGGVATVVARLFNMAAPDIAWFGQKDAQQVAVIRQLVCDLNFDIDIRVCPTVREADGLAMSSRNRYLDEESRQRAAELYRALKKARRAAMAGEAEPEAIKRLIFDELASEPAVETEYVEIVDKDTIRPVAAVASGSMAAVAARVGGARLIDNIILKD